MTGSRTGHRLLVRTLWATGASLALVALLAAAPPTGPAIGYFEANGDVGAPAIAGSTSYDAASQTYTMVGSGTNMWAARDEFQFAWRKLKGDFILRTHAKFMGSGVEPHRKLGWIVRGSLDADSPYADAAIHGNGLSSLQFRATKGGPTMQLPSPVTGPDVIQLERRGRMFIMSLARYGEMFTRTELTELDLGDEVYVGLFVCAHNPGVSERAVFSNVRIVVPPPAGWRPYRDYIGSNLEVMRVDSPDRKVLYTEPGSFQAPNWTRDGKALVYNAGGRLYRFDLATKTPAAIDTGTVISNNNDHVLSFDGTMLGISSSAADVGNQSVIYTVPATGGTPKRITKDAPSYFHGWSPDGKFLFYTAQRNGDFDIYKIPAQGGEEVRLTTATGLDDGPEVTPDGRWVFFNSARTGRMQIWKMRPDGTEQQQITGDELNNWFPHIAPDGKSMVVLSFLPDVDPSEHPFYKQVYIRHMDLEGAGARVLAYVYGGQGTINVPSWSPDSTSIAFVSNSALTAPH
jgi:Tol biopolymer transport system component